MTEYQPSSADTNQYGYGFEEWDMLPDEAKDAIRAAADGFEPDEYEPDDCCIERKVGSTAVAEAVESPKPSKARQIAELKAKILSPEERARIEEKIETYVDQGVGNYGDLERQYGIAGDNQLRKQLADLEAPKQKKASHPRRHSGIDTSDDPRLEADPDFYNHHELELSEEQKAINARGIAKVREDFNEATKPKQD